MYGVSWAVVEWNSAQILSHKNTLPLNSAHNMELKSSWNPIISYSTCCGMNFDALKYMMVNPRPSSSFQAYDDPTKFQKSTLSTTNDITVLKLQLACYPVNIGSWNWRVEGRNFVARSYACTTKGTEMVSALITLDKTSRHVLTWQCKGLAKFTVYNLLCDCIVSGRIFFISSMWENNLRSSAKMAFQNEKKKR